MADAYIEIVKRAGSSPLSEPFKDDIQRSGGFVYSNHYRIGVAPRPNYKDVHKDTVLNDVHKINWNEFEISNETKKAMELVNKDYEDLFQASISRLNKSYDEYDVRQPSCRLLHTAHGYNECMKDVLNNVKNNEASINKLQDDFKNDIADLAYAMIDNCIPCEQIRDYLNAVFGDILKSDFLEKCKEVVEEKKEETSCCVLVLCDPCRYKLIGS